MIEWGMRLFIAVNFGCEVKRRLLELQERLRAQALKGSYTRPENFHLTLAFLGETPGERLEDLFNIIREIESPSFDIVFNRAGRFTRGGKELWWVGADAASPALPLLKAIREQLLARLLKAGFSVDERPFNAHITLAREIKHSSPIVLDCPEIKANVDSVSLMKSERIRGILTYSELMERKY